MRKILLFIVLLFSCAKIIAQQELNAVVTVNADKVQSSNKQVYKTLQKELTEFINQTKWTKKNFLPHERINCAFTIIVNKQDNNNFEASLQVQSTRPVYGSTYQSPLLNINDTGFNFKYNEFEPLIFNPNSYDSSLVSTIVFYVYTILGVDANTFKMYSGTEYLRKAENVVFQAQQTGSSAWENKVGKQNKFMLINNLLSPKFSELTKIFYNYHRKGFDLFHKEELEAKKQILNSVINLKKLHNITVGNYLIRVFLDAKSDEIVNVFSSGKSTGLEMKLQETLQKIAPTYNSKWQKIK